MHSIDNNNRNLSELDMEMNRILSQQDIADDEKVKLYNQVLQNVPKTARNIARLLVNKLKQKKDVVFWNDRGELLYDGKPLSGTSIVDLVRDVMGDRKRFQPHNWSLFSRGLARINTPLDWIGNENRKKTLAEFKGTGQSDDILADLNDDESLVSSSLSIASPSPPNKKKKKGRGKSAKPAWINF
ncbi:hypothetical protein AC249_AIPGENE8473 [Exaiptasia diaphana]|nr:hypothetical protein AC249_AIPGENE8473 [Exaiptasia diaphana]